MAALKLATGVGAPSQPCVSVLNVWPYKQADHVSPVKTSRIVPSPLSKYCSVLVEARMVSKKQVADVCAFAFAMRAKPSDEATKTRCSAAFTCTLCILLSSLELAIRTTRSANRHLMGFLTKLTA